MLYHCKANETIIYNKKITDWNVATEYKYFAMIYSCHIEDDSYK